MLNFFVSWMCCPWWSVILNSGCLGRFGWTSHRQDGQRRRSRSSGLRSALRLFQLCRPTLTTRTDLILITHVEFGEMDSCAIQYMSCVMLSEIHLQFCWSFFLSSRLEKSGLNRTDNSLDMSCPMSLMSLNRLLIWNGNFNKILNLFPRFGCLYPVMTTKLNSPIG